MYARASEHMRKLELDVTLPGLGGPTRRNIRRMASSPNSDVVSPTADHENSLEKASALSKIMDPGPLEGRGRYNIIDWVVSFLTDRDQYTKIGDNRSFM